MSRLSVFYPLLGSQPLAAAILREYQPGEVIVSGWRILADFLGQFLYRRAGIDPQWPNQRLWYGSLFPDAPAIFLDDAQFATLWASAKRVYLVSPSDERRAYLAKLVPFLICALQAENLCSPTGRAGCAKGKSGKPV